MAVKRIGGYTGTLDVTTTAQAGITASAALLSASGDTDTYRVTLQAPAGTAEQAYTFRFAVKATGADNPGSLLVDVRDDFDAIVEVAASPVIADNATVFLQASDPMEHRPAEFLRDSSVYANTFSWNGYARGNQAGHGILCTGQGAAAVFSGALTNTASPQRFNGLQSYCNIFAEVARTPVGGVMMQIASATTDDAIMILRAQGGFSLRHVINGVTVNSPDVLLYQDGYAELGLRVTLTEIILTDRATMRSIRMPRPALPDAGVRVTFGAVRTAAGGYTDVTRTHLMAATIHPYALSDIQMRRNMDKLRDYAPAPSKLPEYSDNAVLICKWIDGVNKYQNRAAPALGLTVLRVGTVTEPPGAVATPVGPNHLHTDFVFSVSGVLTVITTAENFADATDYNCNFGVTSSGIAASGIEVSRRYDGKPMLRHQNGGGSGGDATWSQRSLDKTAPAAAMTFALEVSSSGGASKLTSLDTGQTVTNSGVAMSGNLLVSLGALVRPSGAQESQKMQNAELIVCRGSVSAQALADTRTLQRA